MDGWVGGEKLETQREVVKRTSSPTQQPRGGSETAPFGNQVALREKRQNLPPEPP